MSRLPATMKSRSSMSPNSQGLASSTDFQLDESSQSEQNEKSNPVSRISSDLMNSRELKKKILKQTQQRLSMQQPDILKFKQQNAYDPSFTTAYQVAVQSQFQSFGVTQKTERKTLKPLPLQPPPPPPPTIEADEPLYVKESLLLKTGLTTQMKPIQKVKINKLTKSQIHKVERSHSEKMEELQVLRVKQFYKQKVNESVHQKETEEEAIRAEDLMKKAEEASKKNSVQYQAYSLEDLRKMRTSMVE
ncbi:Hypothetical_protein [Hexamita inflata]|uniref:Hypothetical_protein n=1 Tax=Hexamita inflata TaxID=28002 RepID=A0AA86QW13_9EUKA|nr:Hypothetical protein HINF_LOCUS48054 [Hexamita inflata]